MKKINNNRALSLPGQNNKFGERRRGALKIGQDSRKNGTDVFNEIVYQSYVAMQLAQEPEEFYAEVVSNPVTIAKDDLIGYPIFDANGDGVESAQEYIKVRARVPQHNMCTEVPYAAIKACDYEDAYPVAPSDSNNIQQALPFLHPEFIMPLNSLADGTSTIPPEIGDRIKVKYLDEYRTKGIITHLITIGPGTATSVQDLETSAPDAFNMLNRPINSVFKSDKGPVATLAPNPYDISQMAPGKDVRVGTGETIETVVFDGKLIDKKVAPHLAAMFRDALSEGIDLKPLTSGFRVGFIKDNLTVDELNALIGDGNYTNWDGNPYPKYENVGSSQERLRFVNCGPTKKEDEGDLSKGANCRIATALPVKPGTWAGQQKSGHMMGNGIDVKVGSWGGRPSSKIKTARPDLLTSKYRWLSLNAYKYGFIRTVRSERWHWEWLPGKHQFSRVPRDNPLWDSQFVEGFAQYNE